jgi:hypothetical protein
VRRTFLENAELMRYHSSGLDRIGDMTIAAFVQRLSMFVKVHNKAREFEAAIVGAKLK